MERGLNRPPLPPKKNPSPPGVSLLLRQRSASATARSEATSGHHETWEVPYLWALMAVSSRVDGQLIPDGQ